MTKALIPGLVLSSGNLQAYQNAVNSIPLLTAEEESKLAERYREQNELDAAWRLVAAHLRFVVRIAKDYSGYGLPQEDLIQEGNIGLMKAVKRFDTRFGVRLVSFAVHWIRAEIHEFILRNWRIVKVATTKAQRKLFFNLRRAKRRLGWLNREEIGEIAGDLGVKETTVVDMEQRLSALDASFDGALDEHCEDERISPAGYLPDMRFDPATVTEASDWAEKSVQQVHRALDMLDERSRDIIKKRWFDEAKATLQDLAQQYGVSAERIRQLENIALAKLRASLA
ncbi:MAG: RNA polymerase sigma factor RpoH [Gammaproteobacteria bacterium]|jgi:RNA polymerase sigma-32 factor